MKRIVFLIAVVSVALVATLVATCEGGRDAAVVTPVVPAPAEPKPAPRNRTEQSPEEPVPPPSESPAASGAGERTPGKPVTTVFPEGTRIAQPQHTLHGRVIDADGSPLAGATVTLVSCWLPRELVDERVEIVPAQCRLDVLYPHVESTVTTDSTGRFGLVYHEGGGRRLYVEHANRLAAFVDGPTDAQTWEIRIAEPPPSIEIRVVRASDGSPVAGAIVNLHQLWLDVYWLDAWASQPDPPGAEATTGTDGRCRFDRRTAGAATIRVTAPGLAPALGERAEIPEVGEATREIRLSDGYSLAGRVVDAATGAPVAGAEVRADPAHVCNETVAKTDGDGRFHIDHVAAAQARSFSAVEARAAGYATERSSAGYVDEADRACELTFEMHRAAGLRVRCVDARGESMADVIVAATSSYMVTREVGGVKTPRLGIEDELSVDSGADGRAEIGGLRPGTDGMDLRVRFYLDGVPVFERSFPALRPGETRDLGDVVIAPGLTLHGTVLDADGKSVAGATIVAAPHDESHAAIGDAVISHSGRRAETQPDGTFALMGLTKGLWDLYASADVASPGRLSIGVDPSAGDVSLRLPRVVALVGRVVDAKGSPVANADVRSAREEFGMRTIVSCGTGDDGRFSVPGFDADAGDVEVSVKAPGGVAQKFAARPGVPTTELRLK